MTLFESEFAKVEYIEKDNVVFHIWKKEAHFDDDRKPVLASLEMLRMHKDSVFVADARNGFEDEKEDVEWGFSYFLPELKKAGCKVWGFSPFPRRTHRERTAGMSLSKKNLPRNSSIKRLREYI